MNASTRERERERERERNLMRADRLEGAANAQFERAHPLQILRSPEPISEADRRELAEYIERLAGPAAQGVLG